MQKHTLQSEKRTVVGRKVKTLRATGQVPATIYGRGMSSLTISILETEFKKLYSKIGSTGLVELTIGKSTVPVLINHVQFHPVTDALQHVEFHQVDLKEKVHAKIPLVHTGESPAVEQNLGVLLTTSDEVEVEALPADLPEHIVVDISKLLEVGSELKVSDLVIPKGVELLTQPSVTVVKIEPLVTHEVEEVKPAAEGEAAEGEVATEEASEDTDKKAPSEESQKTSKE